MQKQRKEGDSNERTHPFTAVYCDLRRHELRVRAGVFRERSQRTIWERRGAPDLQHRGDLLALLGERPREHFSLLANFEK